MQQQIVDLPLHSHIFLHGQAGSGKTTAAVQRMLTLIDAGVPAESILILVPQRSLAEPFTRVIRTPGINARPVRLEAPGGRRGGGPRRRRRRRGGRRSETGRNWRNRARA